MRIAISMMPINQLALLAVLPMILEAAHATNYHTPTFQRISRSPATKPAANSMENSEINAVIPSPNDDPFVDSSTIDAFEAASNNAHIDDIIRKLTPPSASAASPAKLHQSASPVASRSKQVASDSKAVPVYVSPFVRAPQSASPASPAASANLVAPSIKLSRSGEQSELESHESPVSESKTTNYAAPSHDLKTSASYGHHGYEHGHKGWLDMGAYTGGKGSFGWYADYPVGGKKHHYGYHAK